MSITNPPLLPGVVLALQGTVLQGPEGPKGADGLSAYQVWLAAGNTGTQADFIASLIGPAGQNGKPVELHKSATHLQWRVEGDLVWIDLVPLVDLKGADGIDGLNGTNGTNGTDGRGIVSIVRIDGNGAPGTIDTFQITYTSGAPSFFTVTHGANGTNGVDGSDGTDGADGRGITSVTRTSGTGAAGTTDTYTITFTDASTSTFTVYNGADGGGAGDMVKSVYDSNDDGKVNAADVADAAPWSGITGKPAVIAAGADAATARGAIGAEPVVAAGTNGDYYRGDKSWQPLNKAAVGLPNADNTSDADKPISTATAVALGGKEPTIAAATGTATDKYWRGDKSWVDFATSVRASVLTGLSVATNAAITAADSVLSAAGKLQAQITGILTFLAGGTANQVLKKNSNTNYDFGWVTPSSGGGLTTVHITGTTATYTAAVGEMVSIESTVAVVVTAPPGLTAGQKWGVMVCNDRWDNSVNMNGNKHENLSDSVMTLKSNKVVVQFEMISTSFGQKVSIL